MAERRTADQKPDEKTGAAKTPADPKATPNSAAMAERTAQMMQRSSRLWADALDRQVESAGKGKRLKPDPLNAVPALSKVYKDWLDHPAKADGGDDPLLGRAGRALDPHDRGALWATRSSR